jgi:hypothetical protein
MVSEFPPLFAEFGEKPFRLLWRGSRDGFRANPFHGRCDGHANTLTLIEDTGQYLRRLHARGVEAVLPVGGQRRSESEAISFHAEESAQLPGQEICAVIIPGRVPTLAACVLPMDATQTTTVWPLWAPLTQTIRVWRCGLF